MTLITGVNIRGIKLTGRRGLVLTQRTTPVNSQWTRIAYSPTLDLFCAVGGNNCMTSPDGITWTNRTPSIAHDWVGITWSQTFKVFIAVSAGEPSLPNRIMTSPDGITWTTRSVDVGVAQILDVVEFAGLIVCVGPNFTITSTDGVNFTLNSIPDGGWNCITVHNGTFVIGGKDHASGRIATSTDGVNWTVQTTPLIQVACIHSNGHIVVAGLLQGSQRSFWSTNLTTWTLAQNLGGFDMRGVTFGGGLWVGVRRDGNNRMALSGDGKRWYTIAAPLLEWNGITYGQQQFVAVSRTGHPTQVVTSPNFKT